MASPISNVVTPQKGLVPLSPFLGGSNGVSLSTSGTTTPAVGGTFTVPANSPTNPTPFNTTAPVPSMANLKGLVTPPNSQNQGTGNPGNGTVTPPSGNVQTNPQNQNMGPVPNPDGSAPAGYSYNGAGQLVPTSSIQPGQTNNTQPSTFSGLVTSLASTASQPSAAYTAAQNQYNQANQGLASLEQQAAQAEGSVNNTPGISLQGATGESGQIQNTLANEAAPLAQEMTAAQSAAQTATGQQGTQQSGLAAAGTLAAPQPGQNPLSQSFNPLTNQYSGLAVSGAGPNAGQAIENYGSLQQEQAIGGQAAQNNSYLGGAQVAAKNLQDLISSNNLNPSALTFANGALQLGAQYTSNPAYAKLPGAINDFVSSIAPILGAGGSVTDMKTQMSSQMVQMLQSGATINDVVQYFTQQAQQKITGMANGGGANISGNGNTNANAAGNTNNSTTGNTTFGSFFGS